MLRQIIRSAFPVLFFAVTSLCRSQLLTDQVSADQARAAVNYIYNLQFKEAGDVIAGLGKLYPQHPALLLLEGMKIYWQYFPLTPQIVESENFENVLRTCIDRCGSYNRDDDPELLLTNLSARGLLLLYYSDNGLDNKVMQLASGTYRLIRKAFTVKESYADFYFFTGLYNYYREAYPDLHPIYKTFVFIFPPGSRSVGLAELKKAAEKGVFLMAEASSFLAYIYQVFENNYTESLSYVRNLYENYPENSHFRMAYIKALLLNGDYSDGENLMSESGPATDFFYSRLIVMKGYLSEIKYKNIADAEEFYKNGISRLASFGEIGNEYSSIAYMGLSRIYSSKGQLKESKYYRKKALSIYDTGSGR